MAAVVALLAASASASAAPSAAVTHHTVRVNNVTIPWAFPPPEGMSSFCSEVPEDVHINPDDLGSSRVKHASVQDRSGGATRVVITDLIKGTAHDGDGTVYTFLYENNAVYDFDGSIVRVAMKDTFHLKGGAVNLIVGFNWRWAYSAASLEVIEGTEDIAIDPFYFATSDGVSEDPNIVPGSWQKLSTRGDPWNCDPL
jgi:hypothetical protein